MEELKLGGGAEAKKGKMVLNYIVVQGKIYLCVVVFLFILLSPNVSQTGLLEWVRLSESQSVCKHNGMGSLWAQLLLQFYTDLFETWCFLSWS